MSDPQNETPSGTERLVCQDIAKRQELGIRKYGTTVLGNPLTEDQWLQHAYEEALDLAVYLKRLIEMKKDASAIPAAEPSAATTPELTEPVNTGYYKPAEKPNRYPLELSVDLHICLWSEDGTFKWTVAHFYVTSDGFEIRFVGDRPLDSRVNWEHFHELIIQGQQIADARFAALKDK